MQTYYLAVDIGASSGRHILGHVENDRMLLEEIYRFDNTQIRQNGHDCWNLPALRQHILTGMKQCRLLGKVPVSLGIDTWAVDYVLLNEKKELLGDAVAYRDKRTAGMEKYAEALVKPQELYARTGIQKQPFNTLYQLLTQKREHPEQLHQAAHFVMLPEYFNFCLTGKLQNEYTNATSTGLVNAHTKTWDAQLLFQFGLPEKIFGSLAVPGTCVGSLTEEVQQQVGFNCTVVLPATHDTGSAFLAVPTKDEHSVFISSGTWSLLGVENSEPVTTEASRKANFTNEGGAWYRFRYLKNIMGLWMIQSIRRELNGVSYVQKNGSQSSNTGKKWSFDELAAAAEASDYCGIVDVDDERFLAPESMTAAVQEVCRTSGQPVPETVNDIMRCVYRSLAACYADSIHQLQQLAQKDYSSIYIVGGGCKDAYLNQLTADAAGLPVFAGPVEGTALGNLMVQMIAAGEYGSLREARAAVCGSFKIQRFAPVQEKRSYTRIKKGVCL